MTDGIQIETGAKLEFDYVLSNANVYLLNTGANDFELNDSQSSVLSFRRSIYAGYLSSTFRLSTALSMKAGGRYEYTSQKATVTHFGTIAYNPYNTLVPSIMFMYKVNKDQTLKLSYTRRIERPDYEDLNPFINASDPKNITTGNINLKPEIGDRVELAYDQPLLKSGSMNATLFLRNNTNDIQPYVRYFPTYVVGDSTYTDVTVRTRDNIGHEDNYGIDLFASLPLKEKLALRADFMCFQRYIYSGISSIANVKGLNYRANLNATYRVSSSFALELFGNYRSKLVNAQGTRPEFITYVIALRKEFLHQQASIAATATNFFQEYVNRGTRVTGDNFTLYDLVQIPYRSVGVNLTYKFGGLNNKNEPEDISLPSEN